MGKYGAEVALSVISVHVRRDFHIALIEGILFAPIEDNGCARVSDSLIDSVIKPVSQIWCNRHASPGLGD
jgi:hypothetical protein